MNPQGPHFTIEAIKVITKHTVLKICQHSADFQQYGGLFNSPNYQLWPQDSSSSFSPLPSPFSSFPPSPSAPSFPSPFNASPSFLSSSYLTSPQTTSFDSGASPTAAINFAQQVHPPSPRIGNSGEVKKFTNNANTDQKLISEPNLKIAESKSDQKPQKSESGEKQMRKSESDPKASSKKKLSLYDALRSRAEMVKSENAVSKSADLLKFVGSSRPLEEFPMTGKTEEMKSVDFAAEGFFVGNSLEEFPVSFHPEEELARKG